MSDAAKYVTDEMLLRARFAANAHEIPDAKLRAVAAAVAGDIAAAVRRHERAQCAAELDELAGMPSQDGGWPIPAWYRTRMRAVAEQWRAGT